VKRRLLLALAAAMPFAAAAPAQAACSASNTYTYSFNWSGNSTLSYSQSYSYTATNSLGATQGFTLGFAASDLSSSVVNSIQLPAVNTVIAASGQSRSLVVGGTFTGRTTDVSGTARVIRTTFTFATPIRDLTISVHDIDQSGGQYRDWLMVQGTNGAASYTPSLTTPYGTSNADGAARTANGSTLALGTYNLNGINLSNVQAAGTATSANTGTTAGDITISFPQPVTTVTLRYGNYPLIGNEKGTGQQAFGISALSFCPMPAIAMTKSSAPWATTGEGRFNAPGSDVVYTLTVTNSGGSPVDLNGLVLTDALPSALSFYNGDFDPAAAGTDPFLLSAGTSGVTLSASNVAYSNNGGASYAYTPAAGYDANVNRVRFSPGGTMAANSSFTIKFRARIK
jgi:uncharacterized repeat protein (TIGR01451 family)